MWAKQSFPKFTNCMAIKWLLIAIGGNLLTINSYHKAIMDQPWSIIGYYEVATVPLQTPLMWGTSNKRTDVLENPAKKNMIVFLTIMCNLYCKIIKSQHFPTCN